MEEYENDNLLETMSIGRLFARMAIPAVLSQMINILYNLVDKMFIGHMLEGGTASLAGLGVTTPVILFLSAWRKIILLIPMIFILPHLVSDPTLGVFLAEPVADLIAVCTTGCMFYRFYKNLQGE